MREILFRAKRADNDEWEYGSLLSPDEFNENPHIVYIDYLNEYGDIGEISAPVLPETVGQYTGLTDRNGKRIFEGDIIEFHEEIGKIKYSDCDAAFDIIFDTWNTNFSVTDGRRIEVIGNIHDNPELLE